LTYDVLEESMKKYLLLAGTLALFSLLIVIQGCDLSGVSVDSRIDSFLADLNQAPRPDSIRFNFSESCLDYATITGLTFGEVAEFPWDSIPYFISISDYDANPVVGTISGTGGSFGSAKTIEFTMTEDGSDWYILKLVLGASTIVQ
jgi:hypothetical protein